MLQKKYFEDSARQKEKVELRAKNNILGLISHIAFNIPESCDFRSQFVPINMA